MDAISAISLILLCLLLGVSGQLVRTVVELRKDSDAFTNKGQDDISSDEQKVIDGLSGALDEAKLKELIEAEGKLYDTLNTSQKWDFDAGPVKKSLCISVFVGLVIGFLAFLYELWSGNLAVDEKFMAVIAATGYAGSDAVEGLYDCLKAIWDNRKGGHKPYKGPKSDEIATPGGMSDI